MTARQAPRFTPDPVVISRNYRSPCVEWWGRAAEDRNQPPAFARLASSGVITLMPAGAQAMIEWGRTIPGWKDGPLVVSG